MLPEIISGQWDYKEIILSLFDLSAFLQFSKMNLYCFCIYNKKNKLITFKSSAILLSPNPKRLPTAECLSSSTVQSSGRQALPCFLRLGCRSCVRGVATPPALASLRPSDSALPTVRSLQSLAWPCHTAIKHFLNHDNFDFYN